MALTAPSPAPLGNVSVHRKLPVTLTFRVANDGEAVRKVVIVIRRVGGGLAKSVDLGPQPADRTLKYRFRVMLNVGHYTWFVSATGADGVERISTRGDRLTVRAPLPRLFPRASAIARALDWAEDRRSEVGVAIVDSRGGLHTHDAQRRFTSASLSKAMLLVAYLRRHPRPAGAARLTLSAMIEESDDASADAIYDVVGNRGLLAVAKLAGMRDFEVGTSWIDAQMTAADQARFFYRFESYLPAESIALARGLLSGITPIQRWGIPAAAGPVGWKVFFKGGWLDQDGRPNDVVTQAAWLERRGAHWSLAVLTADNPSNYYGLQTLKGITGLLLGHEPTAAYLAVVHEGDADVAP